MKRLFVCALLALSGCVSTEMKPLIGHPVQDAQIKYGAPEQIVDMPDGSKAYQFRQAGGAAIFPASAAGVPAIGAELKGCLLTFIAKPESGAWIIRDIIVPKQLAC